jgi:hypothetical protein
VTTSRVVSTFVLLFLCAAAYGYESLLQPAPATRFEVIGMMLFVAVWSAMPAVAITALLCKAFEVLGASTRAFLVASVPLGVAAMALIISFLSSVMLMT